MVDSTENTTLCGVVGLGEVGLRLSLSLVKAGYDVVGVDVDSERVSQLNSGSSYIRDISDDEIRDLLSAGFVAASEYEPLSSASYVAVCVPTPLRKSGQPDISYVAKATETLATVLEPESTVVIESTVYPGATESLIAETFEDAGFTVGEDIFIAFSPERVDPGNDEHEFTEIPKIVGGVTPACGDWVEALYESVFDTVVRVDSATEAEMTKILENTFRNVNIALVNELVKVSDSLEIDFWNVIEAAKTKPYGFMPFYPGPGLGGHCIPVDPLYLSWRARQVGIETPLVNMADKTNREMSEYILRRVSRQLNDNRIPLVDANVLVVGVAYKPDIPDVRNSPGVDLIELLEERNASVSYHDPFVSSIDVPGQGTYESIPLSSDTLREQDITVIVTDHSGLDLDSVVADSSLVFDSRNATSEYEQSHIERL